MRLIEYDGQDFKVSDEAFLIRPVREMYRRDKSRGKEDFWKQLSYMWFTCDPRSPYQYITDEAERSTEVIRQEGLGERWKPSPLLEEAMESYRKMTVTTSALLLADMRSSIEDVRFILKELGRRVKEPQEGDAAVALDRMLPVMTKAIKEIPELAKALVDAEKALARDFAMEDTTRGGAVKAVGEDL